MSKNEQNKINDNSKDFLSKTPTRTTDCQKNAVKK